MRSADAVRYAFFLVSPVSRHRYILTSVSKLLDEERQLPCVWRLLMLVLGYANASS
jgi:hypothetical protein